MMAKHSFDTARKAGLLAMQFNFVVHTNHRAIDLWQRLGFSTIGRIPKAFQHPLHGFVDALIMYRQLND